MGDVNILSRLKCLKSVGLQSPKSLTNQPTNTLAKLNSYQRISCNTLMVADQEDSTQDTSVNPIKLISNIAHGSSLPHLPVITQNDLITDNELSTTSMSTAIPCYNFNHPNGFRTTSSYRRRRFNPKYQKKNGFQANKLKRPTHRHLNSTPVNYYHLLPSWDRSSKSLTTQINNTDRQEDKNDEEICGQQQQQTTRSSPILPPPPTPPPSTLPFSSSSPPSTSHELGDSMKSRRKCYTAAVKTFTNNSVTARNTTKNSGVVSNHRLYPTDNGPSNYEAFLLNEFFTVLNKDSHDEKRKITSYERMHLTNCPIIDSNEICRLLSFQCNRIHRIENLQNLTKLVYLNISANQLTSISGLETLYSLRILLLGQNQIKRICALDNLYNLNVLDLNHNQIRTIENLSHLTKLRSLNLSFNYITSVNGLSGLTALTELNLRQNNILRVEPIENVPKLAWVFLSFNNIERWSQISGLASLNSFAQVTLDGNPIVADPNYHKMICNDRRITSANHNINFSGNKTVKLKCIKSSNVKNKTKQLSPIKNETNNRIRMDENCRKSTAPRLSLSSSSPSSSSGNEECLQSGLQLTPTTFVDSLSNHLKGNVNSEQNKNTLEINDERNPTTEFTKNLEKLTAKLCNRDESIVLRSENCQSNESNPAFHLKKSFNQHKFDTFRLSTSQSTSSSTLTSSTPPSRSEGEDEDNEEEKGVVRIHENLNNNKKYKCNSDISNKRKNKVLFCKSTGTLTNESYLLLSNQLADNSLLKYTYYFTEWNHLIIEGYYVSEDIESVNRPDDDITNSLINDITKKNATVFDNFSQLVNDLQNIKSNNTTTSSSNNNVNDNNIPADVSINGLIKSSHFEHIDMLTIRHVNWDVFVKWIPTIHELLPELKELNLESNGLKYLHQILDLTAFEQLNALRVNGSDGNPIVEQSGQLWRPFVIWSLGDILKLSFLNDELIKRNEINESESLFNSFYERLQLRNTDCMSLNQIIHKKLQNKFKAENSSTAVDLMSNNASLNEMSKTKELLMNSQPTSSLLSTTNENISNNTCTLNPVTNIAIATITSHNNTLSQFGSPLSGKWLGTDNMMNKDCSMDSIKNLSIQLMNTYENSMYEIKEKKNNIIHNLSKTLHQTENMDCETRLLEEKLSRQHYLIKIWPNILKRLIQQAMNDS
ncbi:unnamed protein product [Trichobilharzia szidati]|nr:unnamed protein product [Trichobilharzia szidati]